MTLLLLGCTAGLIENLRRTFRFSRLGKDLSFVTRGQPRAHALGRQDHNPSCRPRPEAGWAGLRRQSRSTSRSKAARTQRCQGAPDWRGQFHPLERQPEVSGNPENRVVSIRLRLRDGALGGQRPDRSVCRRA